MKKFLLFAAVAAVGYCAWRKYSEASEGKDLWAEVADAVE